ncbi:unnamed protein product, partial [Prorocentrum cordatum]
NQLNPPSYFLFLPTSSDRLCLFICASRVCLSSFLPRRTEPPERDGGHSALLAVEQVGRCSWVAWFASLLLCAEERLMPPPAADLRTSCRERRPERAAASAAGGDGGEDAGLAAGAPAPPGVVVHDSAQSPDGTGQVSAVSDVLDDHASFEEFWAQMVSLLQSPVRLGLLKDSRLAAASPESSEFTVTHILDGALLKKMARGGGEDQSHELRYEVDKDRGTVRTELLDQHGVPSPEVDYMVLHRSPLRLESWGRLPSVRRGGERKAERLQAILEAVVARGPMGRGRVEVSPNVQVPPDSGLYRAVSGPLDGLIGFEELWAGIVRFCRGGCTGEGAEFTAKWVTEGPSEDGVAHYRLDEELGEIYCRAETTSLRQLEEERILVARDPLRVELWGEAPGERRVGRLRVAQVQDLINTVLARLHGGSRSGAQVHCGAPSWDAPGSHSVLSEPLDALCDFDALWDAWLSLNKEARQAGESQRLYSEAPRAAQKIWSPQPRTLKDPSTEDEPKEVEILQDTASEFRIRKTVEPSEDQGARPSEQTRYTVRCEGKACVMAETQLRSGQIRDRTWLVFHSDPLLLEWWCEKPGDRRFGPAKVAIVKGYLETIMQRVHPDSHDSRRIPVESGALSPDGSGQRSVMTGPLDRHLDYDRMWFELLDLLKYPARVAELTVLSDTEFIVAEERDGKRFSVQCTAEQDTGRLTLVAHEESGRIASWDFAVLHKEPLRLEWWGEGMGQRFVGQEKAKKRPGEEMVPSLREAKLVEVSATEFVVQHFLHVPAPQKDVHCRFNKEQGWFRAEVYSLKGQLELRSWTKFHKDPLMIECWGERKIERHYGETRCSQIRAIIDSVLHKVSAPRVREKVTVTSDAKLQKVVTAPLGAVVTYERLWAEVVELCKRPPAKGLLKATPGSQSADAGPVRQKPRMC